MITQRKLKWFLILILLWLMPFISFHQTNSRPGSAGKMSKVPDWIHVEQFFRSLKKDSLIENISQNETGCKYPQVTNIFLIP